MSMRVGLGLAAFLFAVGFGLGCEDGEKELFADAAGVARLTFANLGGLASGLVVDDRCGLAAPAVRANPIIEGRPGEQGRVSWSVSRCVLDYTNPVMTTDCLGEGNVLHGRATVTATLTIDGTITGDPQIPVIPAGPDAMSIRIVNAELDGFKFVRTRYDAGLMWREGSISAVVKPRLAVHADTGACVVPTANIAMEDIRYSGVTGIVSFEGAEASLFIPTSNMWAQVGPGAEVENTYGGTMTLFTEVIELPSPGEEGLALVYDAEAHIASFACSPGLTQPVRFDCGASSQEAELAQGLARITMQGVATIAALVQSDARCGFASPNVLASAQIEGAVGSVGRAVLTAQDCVIDLPTPVVASRDCQGVSTTASGRLVVTARQTIEGRITGSMTQPVLPLRDDPISLSLDSVRFDGFRMASSSSATPALSVLDGALSAQVVPRLARGASTGVCSVLSPIARLTDVAWSNARATLALEGAALTVAIDSSQLSALSGAWNGEANQLSGTISVGGRAFTMPAVPSDPGLEPNYSQARFDARWQCGAELATPVSFECDPTPALADGAARLTPLTMATIVQLAERNTTCGFGSAAVLSSARFTGDVGREGEVEVEITTPCEIALPNQTFLGADCHGAETFARGTVRVTGTRTVRGFLTGDLTEPLVPTGRDAVTYALSAQLTEFQVSNSASPATLTVLSGSLAGSVAPRAALDTTLGACVRPTPVATFVDLTYRDAVLRVEQGGSTVDLAVASSNIDAQTGEKDGTENSYAGELVVEGNRVELPLDPENPALDPTYDAARFTASYACEPGLVVATREAMCSFRAPLAAAVSRLMVADAGGLALLGQGACGLTAQPPSSTTPTSATWTVRNCAVDRSGAAGAMPLFEDCLRNRTFARGRVTLTATQTVSGMTLAMPPFVVPAAPGAVRLDVTASGLDAFRVQRLSPGAGAADAELSLTGGQLSFSSTPHLGESASSPGLFAVPTPVIGFSNLTLRGAAATLRLGAKTFRVSIDNASVVAFVGAFGGNANSISGFVVLDGERVDLPPAPLDERFNQAAFDLSYDCTPDLRQPLAP